MCDGVPGQLILSIDPDDEAAHELIWSIREGRVGHVGYVESLEHRIHRGECHVLPGFADRFHLLEVPPGQETWKVSYLQSRYAHNVARAGRPPGFSFNVQPNHHLHLTGVALAHLDFAQTHDDYCEMIGFDGTPQLPDTTPVNVKILDSGVDPAARFNLGVTRDFVDPANPNIEDDEGHGTVVAKIISDLAPDATLHIFKIADSSLANEWNVAAALGAKVGAPIHVINLSLQYGFKDRTCDTCGRASGSSRSWVFEMLLETLEKVDPPPCVVAAAGNSGQKGLAYPARFGTVFAIGSVTSTGALSDFSNWGEDDHVEHLHQQRFVLPGGDDQGGEYVAEHTPSGDTFCGTSFATAYASGLIANVLADQLDQGALQSRAQTLVDLKAAADSQFGTSTTHGNGLMKLP